MRRHELQHRGDGKTWGLDAVEEIDANLNRFYSIWQAISDFGNPNGYLLAGSGMSIPGMTHSWKRLRLCENYLALTDIGIAPSN